MTFGSFPGLANEQAREQAKALRREVDMGSDPMADQHEAWMAPKLNDLADCFEASAARTGARDEAGADLTPRTRIRQSKVSAANMVKITTPQE